MSERTISRNLSMEREGEFAAKNSVVLCKDGIIIWTTSIGMTPLLITFL